MNHEPAPPTLAEETGEALRRLLPADPAPWQLALVDQALAHSREAKAKRLRGEVR